MSVNYGWVNLDTELAGINENIDNLSDDVTELKADLDNQQDDLEKVNSKIGLSTSTLDVIDGYSESNTSSTALNTAPFIYVGNYDFTDCSVTKIKLSIKTIGTVSIGTIKKAGISSGATFDPNSPVLKETMTFQDTGVQEYDLTNPFSVASDEYLWIGSSTDTAVWRYGSYGSNKGFYYIKSGKYASAATSAGVTVTCIKEVDAPLRSLLNSVYNGKNISILGDSISTFNGYIPEGNASYYPAGTVQSVSDTWWKKLIDALGMTLNVNNSWSGSRVTTTDGDDSAGCMVRAQSLGTTPDVIIVWMGINDFNNEVLLGTYDGSTAVPEVTTTFREAYGIMLNKILTAYPSSEVWVCTLPQCERNLETEFPEINGNGVALVEFNKAIVELANAFGVRVLDHNKCGLTYQNMSVFNPDNLHPNKYGHSLVANNDIWQMDSTVKIRYAIS